MISCFQIKSYNKTDFKDHKTKSKTVIGQPPNQVKPIRRRIPHRPRSNKRERTHTREWEARKSTGNSAHRAYPKTKMMIASGRVQDRISGRPAPLCAHTSRPSNITQHIAMRLSVKTPGAGKLCVCVRAALCAHIPVCSSERRRAAALHLLFIALGLSDFRAWNVIIARALVALLWGGCILCAWLSSRGKFDRRCNNLARGLTLMRVENSGNRDGWVGAWERFG